MTIDKQSPGSSPDIVKLSVDNWIAILLLVGVIVSSVAATAWHLQGRLSVVETKIEMLCETQRRGNLAP